MGTFLWHSVQPIEYNVWNVIKLLKFVNSYCSSFWNCCCNCFRNSCCNNFRDCCCNCYWNCLVTSQIKSYQLKSNLNLITHFQIKSFVLKSKTRVIRSWFKSNHDLDLPISDNKADTQMHTDFHTEIQTHRYTHKLVGIHRHTEKKISAVIRNIG